MTGSSPRTGSGSAPVLEADIAYRAGLLAGGGARSLFSDLHPDLRWSGGTLLLTDSETRQADQQVTLGPDGVVLMPSVFIWPEWSAEQGDEHPDHPAVPGAGGRDGVGSRPGWSRPGRGRPGGREPADIEALLGAPRARLLGALRSPATTTALARRLGVTPSAVSQHLAVLHRGGLVDRQRSGRAVLYQASELGLALLGAGSASGASAS